jgi:hypothetical protein
MPTSATSTLRSQADQPTASPSGWPMDQLEFAIQEETPFSQLASTLLDRTAGMFDLHLGMTLTEYQNRWLDLVAIGQETTTARAESARLHQLAEARGLQRRRWQAQAGRVDDFIADALHVLEDWFIAATKPLLAAFDERHPGDEWFGVILADNRASEAYGTWTLQTIIDEAGE